MKPSQASMEEAAGGCGGVVHILGQVGEAGDVCEDDGGQEGGGQEDAQEAHTDNVAGTTTSHSVTVLSLFHCQN